MGKTRMEGVKPTSSALHRHNRAPAANGGGREGGEGGQSGSGRNGEGKRKSACS